VTTCPPVEARLGATERDQAGLPAGAVVSLAARSTTVFYALRLSCNDAGRCAWEVAHAGDNPVAARAAFEAIRVGGDGCRGKALVSRGLAGAELLECILAALPGSLGWLLCVPDAAEVVRGAV
jgi:hypothetical protein